MYDVKCRGHCNVELDAARCAVQCCTVCSVQCVVCSVQCVVCSFRDKCNSSREVQRLSARCAEPQHRRLFRTKSIKHRTPPTFFGANFGACHFFHHQLNRASNPSNLFLRPTLSWPPFVLLAYQSLSSHQQGACTELIKGMLG